jgi:hypothetical protein
VQIDHGAAREQQGAPNDQHLGPRALFPAHPRTQSHTNSVTRSSIALAGARPTKRFRMEQCTGATTERPETNLVRTCGGGTVPGHEAEVPVLPAHGQRTGSEEARGERAPLDADANSQRSVP